MPLPDVEKAMALTAELLKPDNQLACKPICRSETAVD
jgi:hypothetical protein